jgi:multicomponent Na+:H+ antiporter subunit A
MIGRRSTILVESERWLFPLVMLVSVYITFRGHNAPGGGFIGGLIAGAAFIIRHLAGLPLVIGQQRRLVPELLIGAGLLLAAATAMAPLAVGGSLLESNIWSFDWPVFGEVKVVSSAFFDLGVYFLVLGVVVLALVSLAADPGDPVDAPGGEGTP